MSKILSKEALNVELDRLRREGKRISFTNGCFDILHVGHVTYLKEAKKTGDVLILALNSDSSVRAIKGEKRPLVPEEQRAEVVAALECVDYVTIFPEDTPRELIRYLRPQVLVKGGDWSEDQLAGGSDVKSWGGEVRLIPVVAGVSTTNIVEKIKEIYGLTGS
ncbi:MAG: D-glycero-beta-D-manno-heptose 1-phosphate adenylyltransferase [Smithellaceae bacterium]|nr:D-glycero-beta-D-manno-heptose 1-phosphate adenylyltransferase [Smithellaceae bacterium]